MPKALPIQRIAPDADMPDDEMETETRDIEVRPQTPSSGSPNAALTLIPSEPGRLIKPTFDVQVEAPVRPAAVPEENPLPGAERTPLKQLDLRIPDANGGVTVRVQERAGAVQVTVRSVDTQLASGVAEALPELRRGLDREGFRAETWTPQTARLTEPGVDEHSIATGVLHIPDPGSSIRAEQTRAEDDPAQSQREPEWRDEPERRRKRQQEEDFKEYLW
jgi:hypothetical protein